MTAKQQSIFAEQGARLQVTLTGAPIDLTGRLCSLQVRSSRGSSVIQLSGSTADGRLTVAGTSVVVDIPASAMNMAVAEDTSYWVYNVEAWTTADDLIRAFEGLFQITRDVNRADGEEPSQVANYLLTSSVQPLTDVEKANVLTSLGITGTGGDVVGPVSSTDDDIVAFSGTTGKLLKGSGYSIASLLAAARNRALHTGTQLAATISDLAATVAGWLAWDNVTGKPSSFSPSAHASTHATGGGDDVTPASIGAAEASHSHDLSAISQSGATVGQAPIWNGSAWAPAASGGSPGGSGTELQFRSGTNFGGIPGSYYDAINGRISLRAGSTPEAVLHIAADASNESVLCLDMANPTTADPLKIRIAGLPRLSVTPNGMIQAVAGGGSGASGLQVMTDNGSTTNGYVRSGAKGAENCIQLETVYSVRLLPGAGKFIFLDGATVTTDGSQAAPALQLGAAGYGFFRRNGTLVDVVAGGQLVFEFASSGSICFGSMQFAGAGSVLGFSAVQTDRTAGATLSQYAGDSFRINTNNGATTDIALTWSDANIQTYCENEFVVMSPYYLRVDAPASHTIRDLAVVSAVGGYIRSNEVGARIRLRKMKSGEVYVLEKHGTWTIDS